MYIFVGMPMNDEVLEVKVSEKKTIPGVPFPNATLKKFIMRHIVNKDMRVSKEALNVLNRIFDEIGGWIIREAEKMAVSGGMSTISAEHVRDAARFYFGWEGEGEG